MKKYLVFIMSLVLLVLGIFIGLNIKPNEVGRYQLQEMFPNSNILKNTIPKALIDTKTGDVWILIIKDGNEWRQIRGNKVENKGWAF